MTSKMTFDIRGVIEGFYGYYYTFPERNELIKFIAEHGFNYYIYAPKNDRQHRDRWREPYPDKVLKEFKNTVDLAREVGIEFCYALSPINICYSSRDEIDLVKKKLKRFYDLGVRSFSLLVDDIAHEFPHQEDRKNFKSSAEAHVFLCNNIYDWLKELDNNNSLSMCPTDYHGTPPFSDYLHELGEGLKEGINVFYTGPEICSREIKSGLVKEFARVLGRKPLIWDNYPVNDLAMQGEMHIGPIQGRSEDLARATRGIVVNTMIQAEASKIPLLTFADYFTDPKNYDSEKSWERALKEVAGEEDVKYLRVFAENSLKSCLSGEAAPRLKELTRKALRGLLQGESPGSSKSLNELEDYLDLIDKSCYHLLNYSSNIALRNNLLPWIDLLKHNYWMAKRAIMVLRAREKGEDYKKVLKLMIESRANVEKHSKNIAGVVLLTLVDYVLSEVNS